MLGCSICYIPVLGFQPGVRRERVYDRKQFPSAVSRYLVSNRANARGCSAAARRFPSAISRYLVSNLKGKGLCTPMISRVSIRYIAVLGFQPGSGSVCRGGVAFPSAISRYLVSNPALRVKEVKRHHWFPSAISRYLVSNPAHELRRSLT